MRAGGCGQQQQESIWLYYSCGTGGCIQWVEAGGPTGCDGWRVRAVWCYPTRSGDECTVCKWWAVLVQAAVPCLAPSCLMGASWWVVLEIGWLGSSVEVVLAMATAPQGLAEPKPKAWVSIGGADSLPRGASSRQRRGARMTPWRCSSFTAT